MPLMKTLLALFRPRQKAADYAQMSPAEFEAELQKMTPAERDRVSDELMVQALNQQTQDKK